MKNKINLILVFFSISYFLSAQSLDELILKVEDGKVGTLSLPGQTAKILGVVNTSNGYPDIYIQSDSIYPGVYVYKCKSRDEKGTPIFGDKHLVSVPLDIKSIFNGHIFQMSDGSIKLIWFSTGKLHEAIYDGNYKFTETGSYLIPALSDNPTSLSAYIDLNNNINVIASVPQGSLVYPPKDDTGNSILYKLDGTWRGKLNTEKLYKILYNNKLTDSPIQIITISSAANDVYVSFIGSTRIYFNSMQQEGLVAGSYYGVLTYYHQNGKNEGYIKSKITTKGGSLIRIPTMNADPNFFPNSSGVNSDLIVAGRGGIFYYKHTGNFSIDNVPVYEEAVNVLEENALLYGGTMPVPTVADVDNDGLLDIVSGNAEGYLLCFKNTGSNTNPKFLNGKYIESNNKSLYIDAGYGESIEGPLGSRLAYLCPNFFDWDNDGVLDMLLNDSRGKHQFYKGIFNDGTIQYERGKSIYLNGLELRGTWRNRPAVGYLDGKMAYITFDDDDELHLYWKIDIQNIEEGAKLKFNNGNAIKANNTYPLISGRVRCELVDWDGDGIKDILMGVDRWHSIKQLAGNGTSSFNNNYASILFLKNIGTETNPIYENPVFVDYRNQPIQLGSNACGVSSARIGNNMNNKPNLIITDEKGRFYLLEQKNIDVECDLATDLPGIFIDKTSSTLSKETITSPSMVRLPDGSIITAYGKGPKTIISKSQDGGNTWTKISELDYGKNGSLFILNQQLYLIGLSHKNNDYVIVKSEDKGITWTQPTSPTLGLLLSGSLTPTVKANATPTFELNGRLYKEVEQEDGEGNRFIGVMSAAITDNLLYRNKWIYSNYLSLDPSLSGTYWSNGNVIVSQENEIIVLAGINGGNGNLAGILRLSSDNLSVSFNQQIGAVNIPGGSKKFTVRYDASTNKYWAITNQIKTDEKIGGYLPDNVYNNLVLISSADLKNWTTEREILYNSDFMHTGFISTDWLFDGDAIVGVTCLSLPDCAGSVNEIEKANYLISFRVENVR